jgi:hypothetical protein
MFSKQLLIITKADDVITWLCAQELGQTMLIIVSTCGDTIPICRTGVTSISKPSGHTGWRDFRGVFKTLFYHFIKRKLIYSTLLVISLLHSVQTRSGLHPASYPMGTRGSFQGGKAAGA